MGNKLVGVLARTTSNIFMLGLISGAALFISHLLTASGEKFMESLGDDVESLRGGTELSEIRRVA